MKKVLSMFLACVMLLSVTAGLSFTAVAADGDTIFYYGDLDDGTVEINGVDYDGDKSFIEYIVIPSTLVDENGKERAVTEINYDEDYAFSDFPNLKYIIMEDGITSIGPHAFDACYNLNEVIFPSTLKTIGAGAFFNCYNLVGLELPEGLVSIGNNAFNVYGLYTVSIPKSLKFVDYCAFANCRNLANVFYAGTQEEWNQINFVHGNEPFKNHNNIKFNVKHCEGECYGYWVTVNNNTFISCINCGYIGTILPFKDLGGYESYAKYVEYTSVNNRFIAGTNPPLYTQFSPTTSITRAMFVAILYRMAGNPYDNGNNPHKSNPFTDIQPGAYYYNAACWALDEKITNQFTFKPNDNVTREQTARFLFAYAEANDMLGNNEYKKVSLTKYDDLDSVHSWAIEPLKWANYNDMITGTQQGYLNPQGATQRIHATRILSGFGHTCNLGNLY